MSTIRTGDARFCTSSAPCEGAPEGLPLGDGTGIGQVPEFRPGLSAKQTARRRVRQSHLRISTGNWRCLESRCAKYQQNTRCCGLLLTRTTDSGIFSSAAVNGLLRETAQTERFQSSRALLSAWRVGIRGSECSPGRELKGGGNEEGCRTRPRAA